MTWGFNEGITSILIKGTFEFHGLSSLKKNGSVDHTLGQLNFCFDDFFRFCCGIYL